MSNPTPHYSWSYPAIGSDPWGSAFDTYASAIDLTVYSVEQDLRIRINSVQQALLYQPTYTVVVSTQPNSYVLLPTSDGGLPWTIISMYPGGQFHGSFTVNNSGHYALVTLLTGDVRANAAINVWSYAEQDILFRPVISNGTASFTLASTSAWAGYHFFSTQVVRWTFQEIFSLAPGNYSIGFDYFVRGSSGYQLLAHTKGRWQGTVQEITR